jgi:hypothetical protein
MWSMFLSMMFLFFLDSRTRPFLLTSGVINAELSQILFGDALTLTEAAAALEPDRPILTKAQEMMDALMANKNNEHGRTKL